MRSIRFGLWAAVFLGTGAGVFVWTLRLYPPVPLPMPFPRRSSEFRSFPEIRSAQEKALAILSFHPDDLNAHVEMAVACFESGTGAYVQGLEHLERARELGALDARLFYYAAVMYEAQGLPDYAIPEYEKYLRHHPEDLEIRLRLGNLFYRAQEFDKAIDAYRFILLARPGDPLVSSNLGLAYRDKKNAFTNRGGRPPVRPKKEIRKK